MPEAVPAGLFTYSCSASGAFHRLLNHTWIRLVTALCSPIGCLPPQLQALAGADCQSTSQGADQFLCAQALGQAFRPGWQLRPSPQARSPQPPRPRGPWPHTAQRSGSSCCGSASLSASSHSTSQWEPMKRPTTGLGSLQRPDATSASQASWLAARWGSLAFLAWAGCTHCCRTVPNQKPALKQRQQQHTTTARLWARASWMTGRDDVVITALVEKNALPQAPASSGVKGGSADVRPAARHRPLRRKRAPARESSHGCWLPDAGSIAFRRHPWRRPRTGRGPTGFSGDALLPPCCRSVAQASTEKGSQLAPAAPERSVIRPGSRTPGDRDQGGGLRSAPSPGRPGRGPGPRG
jgi:hypothetical protein